MSSITLAQIAEKPITVAIDEAINSFADNRQGRPDIKFSSSLSPASGCAIWDAPETLPWPLNDANASLIS
jgi:hypothetical protein